MNAIERLIRPRSVAIIGASADPEKTSGRPVSFLLKHGFAGEIYPVNPKAGRIGELVCYPDIASLPAVPDVGIVLLGAERAHLAVRELSQRGAAAAIVLASGFTETGDEGALRQKQLMEAAGSMRILGPNTIGLVNLTDSIVLSASGALAMDHFPAGSVGLVSQSGGILGALLSRAAARGIGLSKLVSTSNEADLELSDFIEFLADDEATKVIALYVEAIRNPARFRERNAQGATGRQACRRIQDWPVGGGSKGGGLAYGRACRLRSHVRRAVQAAWRDPCEDLRGSARHSGCPSRRTQAPRPAGRDPDVDGRRRHDRVRLPWLGRLRDPGTRCRDRSGIACPAIGGPCKHGPEPD